LHQVGTSSLLIYMMHGHTYIKVTFRRWSSESYHNHRQILNPSFIKYSRHEISMDLKRRQLHRSYLQNDAAIPTEA